MSMLVFPGSDLLLLLRIHGNWKCPQYFIPYLFFLSLPKPCMYGTNTPQKFSASVSRQNCVFQSSLSSSVNGDGVKKNPTIAIDVTHVVGWWLLDYSYWTSQVGFSSRYACRKMIRWASEHNGRQGDGSESIQCWFELYLCLYLSWGAVEP